MGPALTAMEEFARCSIWISCARVIESVEVPSMRERVCRPL